MPTPKPRKRPARYADAVRPATSAAAYRWPCPRCACTRNLRGLLREVCAHCDHTHTAPEGEEHAHHPPAEQETRHG